jgi:hypothetical protein
MKKGNKCLVPGIAWEGNNAGWYFYSIYTTIGGTE